MRGRTTSPDTGSPIGTTGIIGTMTGSYICFTVTVITYQREVIGIGGKSIVDIQTYCIINIILY